ncbi:MAG TPA: T9SS type A sorting domain-containing protein [Chitinophagaceae bacterium]|nr:T9SS type A sorting domain-containing protein [Chitinophagaceae bacterium]
MKNYHYHTGFFLIAFFFLISNIYAQTTYTWVGANNASWTTSTNWSPARTTPATNDILLFNDGTVKNVTSVPTQTIGSLLIINNSDITLQNSATSTVTVGNGTGDDLLISAGAALTIGGTSTLTVTLNTNSTADISGTLNINAGRIFRLTNSGVVTTVSGTIVNSSSSNNGIYGSSADKLIFTSGSTYQHALNGGTVPTATWNSNSTCGITGSVGSEPSGLNQSFGHFIWNCTSQSGNLNLEPDGMSVAGNITIFSTGSKNLRMLNSNTDRTLNISGNFLQSGGNFIVVNGNGDGTLNINGDFSLSGGSFIFKNANGKAELNVNGHFSMTGGTFDHRASSASSTATVAVSGNFSMDNGTYDFSVVNATGLLNVAGNFSHTGGTITETGSGKGDIVFNGNGIQVFTSGGTIVNTINFTVNLGSTLQFVTPSTAITGDGSFTLSNDAGIYITSPEGITNSGANGNIRVTGSRSYNSGATYIFNGNAIQSEGGGLPSTVKKMTINNNAGIILSKAVTVTESLTLTNGILTTSNSNLLIIDNNATVSGVSNNSYVNGPVRKTGNGSFTFPIGKDGVFSPISISAPANATDVFTAEYIRASATSLGNIIAPGLHNVSNCEYWQLDRNAGTSNVNITVSWSSSSPCNVASYITDLNSLTIAHFNGSSWDSHGNDGGTTGTLSDGTITWNNVSAFSPFSLGSTSSTENTLPVKFGDFKVFEKLPGVQIEWSTYIESNVDRFEIQRSADGRTFVTIGQVKARNLNQRSDYSWYDAAPLPNYNFYRIKSVDIDTKSDFTTIVKISFKKTGSGFSIYPNPVTSKQISFQVSDIQKGEYVLIINNSTGQQVYRKNLSFSAGAITQAIQLPASIQPGIYSLQLTNYLTVFSKAFIVQ